MSNKQSIRNICADLNRGFAQLNISMIMISIIFLFTIPLTPLNAETIYKSVDENGNVSYSTTPPNNSETATMVDIAPPPSDDRIKAAQQRHERNMEAAGVLDENRKKRDELIAEENRLKREKQKQLQLQKQAEKNNANDTYDGYPFYRRPLPGRPIAPPPVNLPAR
ncbi:MAG: DUF4124 domain-containing protein [Gammaproteobacteria bacterium]|nr:DUF4124 domain-containing protein [Gammaproteobacteria bacterium]MBT8133879.1 DUF4124 domain-containing protein [Gammaproteobacteria bacterium]NNJ48853.1 DUF4124 domain-containing protein [Gammaproteobacteria bacterium]